MHGCRRLPNYLLLFHWFLPSYHQHHNNNNNNRKINKYTTYTPHNACTPWLFTKCKTLLIQIIFFWSNRTFNAKTVLMHNVTNIVNLFWTMKMRSHFLNDESDINKNKYNCTELRHSTIGLFNCITIDLTLAPIPFVASSVHRYTLPSSVSSSAWVHVGFRFSIKLLIPSWPSRIRALSAISCSPYL